MVAASKHRALKEALAFKKVGVCSVGNLCSQFVSLPAHKDTVAWGGIQQLQMSPARFMVSLMQLDVGGES